MARLALHFKMYYEKHTRAVYRHRKWAVQTANETIMHYQLSAAVSDCAPRGNRGYVSWRRYNCCGMGFVSTGRRWPRWCCVYVAPLLSLDHVQGLSAHQGCVLVCRAACRALRSPGNYSPAKQKTGVGFGQQASPVSGPQLIRWRRL